MKLKKHGQRLKVGLLGLSGAGGDYLAALDADERFELVAVADSDPDLLRRWAVDESFRGYTDPRSLIVESARSGLDLLVVALEPFESVGFVELAARNGLGVFLKVPPARTVSELRTLIKPFSESRGTLVPARYWQAEPAYASLRTLPEVAGHVYAAVAEVQTTAEAFGWRGDSALAGGGVLLNGAYEQLDMLVTLLGLPETVYAQCGVAAGPGEARKYNTEDAACVSMRFAGGRIAALIASRRAPQAHFRVTFMGTEGTIDVRPDGLTITPRLPGHPQVLAVRRPNSPAPALRAFAESRGRDEPRPGSPAESHVATLAVVEAAYLSARTGAPEHPARFL